VLFVSLSEADYGAASFLDERILPQAGPGHWSTWAELVQSLPPPGGECDFIFHIGHVGSTLLSRLFDHSPRIFGLREPSILRSLAWTELDGIETALLTERARIFLRLWSRTWRREQKTLIKATSFTSEIAPLLMRLQPSARALLMYVAPRVYIASILAGDASRAETRFNAPKRLSRLHRRLGLEAWRLGEMTEGEVIAMSWVSEMLSLDRSAEAFPDRVMWLDFEAFLKLPADWLSAGLTHLHGQAPAADVAAMSASPALGRYSKAPEHAYDAALRARVLAQSEKQHAYEIGRGVRWLADAVRAHALLGDSSRIASAVG
jgi:hypothetical protein